ncbi:CxC ATPase DNA modification system associated small protein [Methylotetracoccus oryzae]|uniref:CxC ATPase DNA modification system associated small protein n=1 Tax=Methylotetracoccus oryzae TaxID=1919059 RepID=UPI00111ABDFA|nr:CxC ATPase DNA modification system associated small protein [Methylotetracoccus oryzae]
MESEIELAIRQAVLKHGQSADLANKLVAWMKALKSGNDQIEDRQSYAQRTNVLYESVIIGESDD